LYVCTLDNSLSERELQFDLVLWSDIWDVPLNEKKCKVIRFGKTEEKPRYFIRKRDGSSQKLEISEGEKDIGLLISSDLKWSNHVNTVVNNANRLLGIVKKTFKHLDCKSFLFLYQSLIRLHLDYAVSLWNPSLKQDIQLIEKVQERATKLVNCLKHLNYEERLIKLDISSLDVPRVRSDLIQFFKILKEYEKVILNKGINYSISNYSNRRNVFKLTKELIKNCTPRSNFFTNRIVNVWNKLPNEVVQARNLNCFKSMLDKWMKSNCKSLLG